MKRIPRPKNTTINSINYNKNKEEQFYQNLIYTIMLEYVTKGFTLNGKQISLHQISNQYNVPIELLNNKLVQITKETGSMILGNDLVEAHQGALGIVLGGLFDDRGYIVEQLNLLLRSQGASYKPFISSAVNQALKLMLDSSKNMMDWADKIMPKNSEITNLILNQNASESLSAEDAIRHIRQGALPGGFDKALPSQDQSDLMRQSLGEIYQEHDLKGMPNVRANGEDEAANINVKAKQILEDPQSQTRIGKANMDTIIDEEITFEDL